MIGYGNNKGIVHISCVEIFNGFMKIKNQICILKLKLLYLKHKIKKLKIY